MSHCNTTDCSACAARLTDFVLVVHLNWHVLKPKELQHPEHPGTPEHNGTPGTPRNTKNNKDQQKK